MKQNYFVYNGQQYNTGTIITIQFVDCMIKKIYNTNAKFLYYDTEKKEYVVEIYGKEHLYEETLFYRCLRGIANYRAASIIETVTSSQKHTFTDELNIDGLLIAWIWYVFIMAVGVIFYDRIGIWILASIIFFNYRNNKLKEAGYK